MNAEKTPAQEMGGQDRGKREFPYDLVLAYAALRGFRQWLALGTCKIEGELFPGLSLWCKDDSQTVAIKSIDVILSQLQADHPGVFPSYGIEDAGMKEV